MKRNLKAGVLIAAAMGTIMYASTASASSSVDPDVEAVVSAFDTVWDIFVGLFQGTFGRIVAAVVVIVGVVIGVKTGSMLAFITGPLIGIGLFFMPDLLEGLQGDVALNGQIMLDMMKDTHSNLQ